MKKLLVGNWKQNKNLQEIDSWFTEFSKLYTPNTSVDVVICAPVCYLDKVSTHINTLSLENVFCGAQDVSEFTGGAHTGEVAASQLRDFVNYALVGHSERKESWSVVSVKLANALSSRLIPILCVSDISNIPADLDPKVIIALEDPSNISGGGVYKSIDSAKIINDLKKAREKVGKDKILIYGGSANASNQADLFGSGLINGFLPGKASLEATSFTALFNSLV